MTVNYCKKCFLKDDHPGITFNEEGVCQVCSGQFPSNLLEMYKYVLAHYNEFFSEKRKTGNSYDCMLLLSGGKDSTYMLYNLCENLNLNVLAYTYNHPFESKQAINNIEKAYTKLNIDHISFTTVHKHKKLMKYIFTKKIDKDNMHYQDERIPCKVCSSLIIFTAYIFAKNMNIPYVIYCADPGQMLSCDIRIKKQIEFFYNAVGEKCANEMFNNELKNIMETSDEMLPKIVYPYLSPLTYDQKKIIKILKDEGLYESSPVETHCSLYPLLNYYSYKNYDCAFYSADYADAVRKNKMSRKTLIDADKKFKKIIMDIAKNDKISKEREEEISSFLSQLISLWYDSESELATKHMKNNILDMHKIAEMIDWDIANDK